MSTTKQQQQPQDPPQDTEPSTAIARREARPSPVATVADLRAVGESIAQSGMFGTCTPGKGLVIWSICEQEGISLLEFLRTYHVTNRGQVSMRADRMMAEFLARGGRLIWTETSNERAAAKFSYGDNQNLEFEFTLKEARRRGLVKEDSAWESDPGAMMRARVITRGVRAVCPGVCAGVYTPEELDDAHDARDDAPAPTQAAPARKVPPQPQPQPQQRTAAEQAAIATVADALDGEIVDDAPESPMDPPPPPKQGKSKASKPKAAPKSKAAAPAPPPNFAVCPIPGKLHGKAWDTMDRSVLQHALDNMRHQLEPGHIAEIERLMAPRPEDTLPF